MTLPDRISSRRFPLPSCALTATAFIVLLYSVAGCEEAPSPAERTFIDFSNGFDISKLTCNAARASVVKTRDGMGLAVHCDHSKPVAGVILRAPGGSGDRKGGLSPGVAWDLGAYEYVVFTVTNTGKTEMTVSGRVDNAIGGGNPPSVRNSVTLAPGESRELRIELMRTTKGTLQVKLFGMLAYPPQTSGGSTGTGVDPAKINQVAVYINSPAEDYDFEVGPIRSGGSASALVTKDPLTEKTFFPFIDEFGQYIHSDWPGKTHSEKDFPSRLAAEEEDLKAHPAPANFDSWGGWKDGPTLQATGFFRTEKVDGKWWFVDPEGRLFFSLGIDCVKASDNTPTDERASWFKDFPGNSPGFQEFVAPALFVSKGYYKGQRPQTFNFCMANLKRKYGEDWENQFGLKTQERLRSWGINTIGAWSSEKICGLRKTPYTVIFHSRGRSFDDAPWTASALRDAFDPNYEADLKKQIAAEEGKSAGDPWCLGYFVDNEVPWGDEYSLAITALKSPAAQPAKKVFVDDMKAKYSEISRFNAAWATRYASWDALLESRDAGAGDRLTAEAKADLGDLYTKIAEKYFEVCRNAIKAVAPKQLYLGCRFRGGWNPRIVAAASRYCDVVSFNVYDRAVAGFNPPIGDRPLMVGEFHFGAVDRGLFSGGLVPVPTQTERANLYRKYVESALKNPQVVGAHWFQFVDQPTIGRTLDGENGQIGFLDIADTPYPETVAAARQMSSRMYETRSGKK